MTETAPIAESLAAFAHDLRQDDVPPAAIERSKELMLDGLGIALAAARGDSGEAAVRGLMGLGEPGNSTVIGRPERLPLRDAMLVNGSLVHAYDFDDTHMGGIVHTTASALPLALGLAERHRLSGQDLLLAYLIAVEVSARIGMVAKGAFHPVGFHPSSVCAVFGSALAAGRVLGLDRGQMVMAQGIALSQAAGTFEFLTEGSWTKRLHPGFAAACGLTAAALAKGGYTGPRLAYEGRFGLFACYLGPRAKGIDLALATAGLGERFEVLGVGLKPYPACHFMHGCIDAALALHPTGRFDPERVLRVTALVPEGVVSTVCEPIEPKRRPSNAYEAQFSIPYVVATALLRGRFGLAELTPAALADPQVLALAAKVGYAIDRKSAYPRAYSGELEVKLQDGTKLGYRQEVNRGAPDRPLSRAELVAKFRANAPGREDVEALVLGLDGLEDASRLAAALAERPAVTKPLRAAGS